MVGKIIYGTGDKPNRYYLDGTEVTREAYDERFPSRLADDLSGGLPAYHGQLVSYSDALGVHPKQVKEAEGSAKKRGVPTNFLPDGRAVITSRAHQKKYLKAYGYYNRDGGYGD